MKRLALMILGGFFQLGMLATLAMGLYDLVYLNLVNGGFKLRALRETWAALNEPSLKAAETWMTSGLAADTVNLIFKTPTPAAVLLFLGLFYLLYCLTPVPARRRRIWK